MPLKSFSSCFTCNRTLMKTLELPFIMLERPEKYIFVLERFIRWNGMAIVEYCLNPEAVPDKVDSSLPKRGEIIRKATH